MGPLTVFTFSGDWGLPSTGPFALKLLKWLDLAGLPHVQKFEDDPRRGPKGKNPWIEVDGRRVGDTELIIAMLAERTGFDIDARLDPELRARGHAVRRMLEEHFHMVLEWELFAHPAGAAYIREAVGRAVPGVLAGPIAASFCGHFRKQLTARGIARHSDEVIAGKGKADLDAVEALLGGAPFLGGDAPSMADVSAYGLLAPMVRWPMRTPVADDLKRRPALVGLVERLHAMATEQRRAA